MELSLAVAPPLGSHQVLLLLLQVGSLLLVALLLGRVARRFGLPAVVGELATGVLLGPSVLGGAIPGFAAWLFPPGAEHTHLLDAVTQLAVLALVGTAGAQVDTRLLRRRRGVIAKVSVAGLVIPLGLGVAAGYFVPAALMAEDTSRPTFALFLGVALCVSAIPVIAKTLADMHLLHRDVGQLTLASASVQDSIGWFLLSLVSTMAVSGLDARRVGLAALYLVGFLALAVVVGRPLVLGAMRLAGRSDDPGAAVTTAFALVVLGAAGSQALGLEAVLGAFVAGVLIGSPRLENRRLLAPLHTVTMSVFAPIFLASAGLRIDLTALRDPTVLLAGVGILLVATIGKVVGGYLGARLGRLSHWEGLAIGAGLNARGVVEIVVASVGLRLGVLTTATYTIVVLVAVATSLMAPPLLRWAMARVEHNDQERIRAAELSTWMSPSPPVAVTSTQETS